MDKKVIIFDFDGVIIDSLGIVVSISKKIAKISLSRDDRELGKKDSDYFRSLSSDEFYFKMPKWKMLVIVIYVRMKMARLIRNIRPIKGIKEEIEKLKKEKYTLGILSSNSRSNIKKFLSYNNIDCFDFVYSGSVFLKKDRKLKKIIKKHNFKNDEMVFIGDETRDIQAAKINGVKNISVSWGYTAEDVLKKYNPDYIISRPEQLFPVINQIYR